MAPVETADRNIVQESGCLQQAEQAIILALLPEQLQDRRLLWGVCVGGERSLEPASVMRQAPGLADFQTPPVGIVRSWRQGYGAICWCACQGRDGHSRLFHSLAQFAQTQLQFLCRQRHDKRSPHFQNATSQNGLNKRQRSTCKHCFSIIVSEGNSCGSHPPRVRSNSEIWPGASPAIFQNCFSHGAGGYRMCSHCISGNNMA